MNEQPTGFPLNVKIDGELHVINAFGFTIKQVVIDTTSKYYQLTIQTTPSFLKNGSHEAGSEHVDFFVLVSVSRDENERYSIEINDLMTSVCPHCKMHDGKVIIHGDSEEHEIVRCDNCGEEFDLPLYQHWEKMNCLRVMLSSDSYSGSGSVGGNWHE